MNLTDLEKVQAIRRHTSGVEENTFLLGTKLIEAGEPDLGLNLIANGQVHDQSKYHGIEYLHLWPNNPDKAAFGLAHTHHSMTNPHHPEYWGSIHKVPDLYVAEMVCDWKARAAEFGTSVFEWIETAAMKRFGFTKQDDVYERIMRFLSLLCDRPFTDLKGA